MGGDEMKEVEKNDKLIEARAEQLAEKIEVLVKEARQKVASVVNTAQVYTYYEIGRYIIEAEQGGKARAEYGKGVLKRVSERLTERLGKGWSVENLTAMRKFYVLYSKTVTSGYEINGTEIQTTDLEIQSENRNQRLRNLLCERKNDALVELTLPKAANIYAQQYALCLPDKALLQQKLREWIAEFKEKEGEV